jgi:hypothetical protein
MDETIDRTGPVHEYFLICETWGRGSTLIPPSRGKHSRCPTNFSKAHVNRRSASFGSGILECPNEPPHGAGKCEEPRRYAPRKVDGGRYGDVDDGHRQRRIILATMHCAYLQNLLTSILTAQSNRCLDIVHTPPGLHFSRLSSSIPQSVCGTKCMDLASRGQESPPSRPIKPITTATSAYFPSLGVPKNWISCPRIAIQVILAMDRHVWYTCSFPPP